MLNTPPRCAVKSTVGIATGFNTVGSGFAVDVVSGIEVGGGEISALGSGDSHAVTTALIIMKSRMILGTKGVSLLDLLVKWVTLSRLSVPQALNIE
tara:strand:- start:149 stop:436 length:288 start_codon:yes stop_codon:yes gene_type:complete